jgi:tripartite ATP-independent transporter DctP family solute receptor
MRKRVLVELLVLALIVALSAISATAGEKKVIKVSIGVNEVHPLTVGMKKFGEVVASKTDGRYDVQVYPNAQLGDDIRATEAVRAGQLEMTPPTTSPLSGLSKELAVFDLPFLFPDSPTAWKVLDGPFGQRMLDGMASKNLKALGFWENGFRQLSNSVREVKSPADVKGMKIRTMENPIHLAAWRALGANPTPMPFSEVFTALQQKTIDGQENPIPVIYLQKLYEVQKYTTLTGHIYSPFIVLMNLKLWESLPKEDQAVFMEANIVGRDLVRQLNKEAAETQIAKLRQAGMTVTELTPAQLKLFQDAVQPVYKQFEDRIGKQLIEEIHAEIQKASK